MRRNISILLLCGIFALTGCRNGNLFGGLHKRGDSGDTEILLADADVALSELNYTQALELYERVLAQNPSNSLALYGAATAGIGSSGLNIARLISNVTRQNAPPAFHNLTELIGQSRETIRGALSADANSLLAGIDPEALNAVIDPAICRLRRIVSGATDGTISPNDIDVLLNLGSLCAIRAVLKPLRSNLFDIKNTGGTFIVTNPSTTALSNFCGSSTPSDISLIQTIARDVVGAWALFNKAANLLNLSDTHIIKQLRGDVKDAADQLFASGTLPASCLTVFLQVNISSNSFTSTPAVDDFVFNTPPTEDCNQL